MSIIRCEHCENLIDTDFDVEHEEECREETPPTSPCCNSEMSYIGENEHTCHSCGKVWDLGDIDPTPSISTVEEILDAYYQQRSTRPITKSEHRTMVNQATQAIREAIERAKPSFPPDEKLTDYGKTQKQAVDHYRANLLGELGLEDKP